VRRFHTPTLAAVGSLSYSGCSWAALYWRTVADRPVVVYAAAAVRPPLEAIAREYQRETGQPVRAAVRWPPRRC